MSTIIYGNISRCLSLKDECYQLLPISELTLFGTGPSTVHNCRHSSKKLNS